MKRSILFLSLILISSGLNTAQFNPVSHKVQFDFYSTSLEHWYNLTMTDNAYFTSSDDLAFDNLFSDVNYFDWNSFESDASDGGFFDLDQTEENPNYVLSFTRLEQTNTISLQQLPATFDTATGWIKMMHNIFSYQQKILSIDFNEFVWPVATQMDVMESYPEQYSLSVLFQRGNDNLRCCFNQNVSLFVGIDFDMNSIEEWMANSTYSDTVHVDHFINGNTTQVTFPSFFLRTGNSAEIEAYPLDRVTFMVIQETGMALLTSFGEGFQDFVFQTDIEDASKYVHEYTPFVTIDGTQDDLGNDSSDSNGDLEVPIAFLPVIVALISTKIIRKKN
ncbi:MAG: hypothetical protein GPJ54_10935 [Candidatus Heimdallarchaeota archaeon]|nr:hypothetical protein [Candidatus Heimdallarchaeota archaeon]